MKKHYSVLLGLVLLFGSSFCPDASAQTPSSGEVALSCLPPAGAPLAAVQAELMAFKTGFSGYPDPLFNQSYSGGAAVGGAVLGAFTYVLPANWREAQQSSDVIVSYVMAPGVISIDSDSFPGAADMQASMLQQVGVLAGSTAPSLVPTEFGAELEFSPLIELDGSVLSTSCTLSGEADDGMRLIIGYDIYRLPQATYPAPSLRDFLVFGYLGHASMLALDMEVADDTGWGCSDLDTSDETRVRNPDGSPDTGDEVVVFRDTSFTSAGGARANAADPEKDYWYRVQPVVAGSLDYFETGGTVSSAKLVTTVFDMNADGVNDGVDLLDDGSLDFVDPSGRGLGLTHGGEILSSLAPGSVLGAPPLADSDGDGLSDSMELALGLDPVLSNVGLDTDGDEVADVLEAMLGSDPLSADGDFGGEPDARELFYGRSPANFCDDVVLGMLGDVMPSGVGDGQVAVGDVVKLLRFSVLVDEPTPWELTTGDIAPAELVDDSSLPEIRRRHSYEEPGGGYTHGREGHGDGVINVTDVVLALRASVGLTVVID